MLFSTAGIHRIKTPVYPNVTSTTAISVGVSISAGDTLSLLSGTATSIPLIVSTELGVLIGNTVSVPLKIYR